MTYQAELIRQAQDGDKKARDKVISDNLGLVHAIVRRFEQRGHDREELFQVGCIGLIKAVSHFDLSLNLAFSTYAVPLIMGEIRRFLRDDGMVKVSRSLKENGYKIGKAKEMLTKELGREPTLMEIAVITELSKEEIIMALEANYRVESIYQPVAGSDGEEMLLIDQIKNKTGEDGMPETETVLNELLVGQLLDSLDETEKKLIRLRYYENKTQCDVAKILSVTQVQVSRMEKKILRKMRDEMNRS